ncbi:uncharacterized protein LOC134230856 [Saccostrea cucullata]|uniref:uncharacterized protein LOC134230856 n=1 Tax=Saccostrea cuccullata TaxID=36930 RepID=UPI002ED6BB48
MAENESFLVQKSLPDLKKFLTDRGIRVSGYRKHELLDLAREACRQNLQPKCDLAQDSADRLKRRTVHGVTYPHPSSPNIKWDDCLDKIPSIEAYDIQYYLKTSCLWTNERLKNYKSDNSYRLHSNGHISNVAMSKLDSNLCYIRGSSTPEERQTAEPYKMWLLVQENGTIVSGECTCVAGDGTCKHIAALLFGLQQFCLGLNDRTEIGVTDKKAKWTNPVRSTRPVKITDLDLRQQPNNQPQPMACDEEYTPVTNEQLNNRTEKDIYKLLKAEKLAACAAYTLSDSSDSEYEFEESVCENVTEFAQNFYVMNPNASFEEFVDGLRVYFDRNLAVKISKCTVGQNSSDVWHHQRAGRITASSVFNCLHFSGRNENGSLVTQILCKKYATSESNCIPALVHGRKYEAKARDMYLELNGKIHTNLRYSSAGLIIDDELPFIGASPDGLLECNCCLPGCLEIKCPYKYKDKNPKEAAACDLKNFELRNGFPVLRKNSNSPYYCQMMCQMAVTKRTYCDFILYTHSGIFSERVFFNGQIWECMKGKIVKFYKTFIFPKIIIN